MTDLTFTGPVEKGDGLAKGLGCPTANISVSQVGIVPGLGVYTGEAEFEGHIFPSIVIVTDGRTGESLRLEVHCLGQDLPDLTGKLMIVKIFEKLRPAVPWESDAQVGALMLEDIKNAQAWFAARGRS